MMFGPEATISPTSSTSASDPSSRRIFSSTSGMGTPIEPSLRSRCSGGSQVRRAEASVAPYMTMTRVPGRASTRRRTCAGGMGPPAWVT